MIMFIIGLVAAWLLLSIFWDVYVMILPAIPIILLIERNG